MLRDSRNILIVYLCFILGIFINIPLSAQKLQAFEQEMTQIYNSCKSYAVTISVSQIPTGRNMSYPPAKKKGYEVAIGSGFLYDNLGHIVTTSSVTEKGNFFKITFSDGTTRFADLVGTDDENNVSVLKIGSPPFSAPDFADSEQLTPGLWVGLISNSFGIFPSFSYGIASGRNNLNELLITADISPGSAGGLVINSNGQAVGMIAYKLTEPVAFNNVTLLDNTTSQHKALLLEEGEVELPVGGVSLAIPSNKIRTAADNLISGIFKSGGFLGVYPENLDLDWAKRFFNVDYGVFLAQVLDNSPAYIAGIREGDILLKFNNRKIKDSAQLRKLIRNSTPGLMVPISILRAGKTRSISVVVGDFKKDSPDYGVPSSVNNERLNNSQRLR